MHLLKQTKEDLKLEIYDYLKQKEMSPVFEDGFVYAKGDIPILLVAHMDTVFQEPPKRLFYDISKDMLYSPDNGIGGDDRCGIYAIMQILKRYKPHVLFTEDEEIGCIGALKAVNKLDKPNVKYIIEFDRKGSNDCVFYECGNREFMNYIESFGFVTDYGTYSDISVLGSMWDIAAVNLSSGYYHEHTDREYIIFHELQNNIKRAQKMLKDYEQVPYFDYQEITYVPRYYSQFHDNDDSWYEEDFIWDLEESDIIHKDSKYQDGKGQYVLRKEENK